MTRARRSDELEAIREVLRAIRRSPFDMEGVLEIVVERLTRLVRADYGMISVPDPDGRYRAAAGIGLNPAHAEYERQHPTPVNSHTLVGRVVLAGETVQIEDVAADPGYRWPEGQALGGFRTMLGVPIGAEERLIGVVTLARTEVRPYSAGEVELARTFADQAAIVIENVRLLRTIERQREELARYLPSTVAKLVWSAEGEKLLAGHRREVTAVFCDLRGFTAFAEAAEPEEVLRLVRQYHEEMGAIITAHHGTLEHYAGDAMMVFLNDPEPVADHPIEAVRMALEMRERFGQLSSGWRREGFELGLGIAVSVGFASLGRIGFGGHYGYAAIGSTPNLAARLCALAKPGQIVLSERVYARLEGSVTGVSLGSFELKGFRRPIGAYELTGLR
jgi:class 3 adenylate cyclase